MTIFDAAVKYKSDQTPLCVIAGKEYGSGSSRDWAAKGSTLLGIRFVIAESFERIHRSNLVGMGVLPLQFEKGQSAKTLGLTGREHFDLIDLREAVAWPFVAGRLVRVRATLDDRSITEFKAIVRIDTPQDALYYANGGILHFVLRHLLRGDDKAPVLSRAISSSPQKKPGHVPSDQIVHKTSVDSFPASDPPAY